MFNIKQIFLKTIYIHIFFLTLMSIHRVIFFFYFNELDNYSKYFTDIIQAFFLGFRIDTTVSGYIQLPITLILICLYYLKNEQIFNIFNRYIKYYFFILYLVVFYFLSSDFGFYSYFKEHINILYFGILDDDTKALIKTIWANYNIPVISLFILGYIIFVFKVIQKIYSNINYQSYHIEKKSIIYFFLIIILNIFIIRGTLGMYPLGKIIPNISTQEFINKIPHNGMREFIKAYKIKQRYNKNYDLINQVGFKNHIEDAFKILKDTNTINKNLLKNITYTTSKKDIDDYNVVIIMVESFGMPILKYQSDNFNIMGSLKQHFKDDILFTNFISSGDGTIPSLESMLLNIPYRIGSFPMSQSQFKTVQFDYSPAFVFKKNNYNTTFIYGGDLSWRDIGNFVKYQGYDDIIGKAKIYNSIKNKKYIKEDYFHPWGIYDQYMYNTIYKKLLHSTKKEYIFALSTNNHPPYTVPKEYKIPKLQINDTLKKHIISNLALIQKRFESYSYALHSLGDFLTKIKNSKLKDNTIVVVTADNNTIEGNMRYTQKPLLTAKNIPFYIYIPKKLRQNLDINTAIFGSHKDIFPTIYNLILSNTQYISVGTNMLNKTIFHCGVNGSKIVASKNKILKANNLQQKSKYKEINYYRALLAVSEYLLNQYKTNKK